MALYLPNTESLFCAAFDASELNPLGLRGTSTIQRHFREGVLY